MAHIIYTANPNEGAPTGSLFSGKKIFLTQKTPSRSHFIELIKANGGEVVKLEKSADIIIADDARKEVVPGSYSYKWIDQSIKNGALEDLDNYLAGPRIGVPRAIGSVIRPTKNTRTAYTAEDDRMLIEWIQTQTEKGAMTSGNETFKQLEAQNPRHTWQSWRDRWVKTLRFRPPPPPTPQEAPLTPRDINSIKSPIAARSRTKKTATPKPEPEGPTDVFTSEDVMTLQALTPTILEIHPERVDEAWNEWAQLHPGHSAERWQMFWQTNILPFAKHGSSEIVVTEEEIPSSRESTPVTSPSFHTRSSHALQETPTLLKVEVTELSSSPLKRKRSIVKAETSEIPSSPPIMPQESTLTAYSPYKKRVLHTQEVPSTPESEALATNQPLRPQPDPHVNDALDEVEHSSIEADSLPERPRETTLRLWELRTMREDPTSTYGPGFTFAQENGSEDELAVEYPRLRSSPIRTPKVGRASSLDKQHVEGDDDEERATQVAYPDLPPFEGQATEDTQAILREEAPAIDFGIAEPDEGWQAFQSSPPPMPSSSKRSKGKAKEKVVEEGHRYQAPTLASADDDVEVEELSAWINRQLKRGHPMDHVRAAMTATTMDFDLAGGVLRGLRSSGSIPAHARGIWTPSDDADLFAGDARKIRALQHKHGNGGLDRRMEFLKTCRAVQRAA